jgi:hypothetical protein
MNMRRLVAVLAAAAFVAAAAAIEPPPPAPASQEPAPAGEEKASDAGEIAPVPAAEEEGEETLPPLPPDTVPVGPPPQRFNPTEKVRADFPVSFPIDI